jgi:hypothetical protein
MNAINSRIVSLVTVTSLVTLALLAAAGADLAAVLDQTTLLAFRVRF